MFVVGADFAAGAAAGAVDFAACATCASGFLPYALRISSSVGKKLPVLYLSRTKLVPIPTNAPAVPKPGTKDAAPEAASIADPV